MTRAWLDRLSRWPINTMSHPGSLDGRHAANQSPPKFLTWPFHHIEFWRGVWDISGRWPVSESPIGKSIKSIHPFVCVLCTLYYMMCSWWKGWYLSEVLLENQLHNYCIRCDSVLRHLVKFLVVILTPVTTQVSSEPSLLAWENIAGTVVLYWYGDMQLLYGLMVTWLHQCHTRLPG